MQDFIESNGANVTSPMYSPIPPVVNEIWEFPEDEYQELLPSYDPDQAQSLLDEHAPDDFTPTIITPEDPGPTRRANRYSAGRDRLRGRRAGA